MTADISTLEAKAAKAQAAYEAAQQAAYEARAAEQAKQDARAREIAQRVVDSYDDAEMFRQIRQAREEFAKVFIESDIGKAWIAFQLAELRHAHGSVDYNTAASQVGRFDQMPPRPAGNAIVEQLGQIVDRAAADTIAAELQARDAERAAYISGTQEENR